MDLNWMPSLNAGLNGLSLLFLLTGRFFISRGREKAHQKAMLGACVSSLFFLVSYLVYHFNMGHTSFAHQGWIRPVYFTILITHVLLAVSIPVFAVLMLRYAFTNQREKHRRLGQIAWPLWVYVSASGLAVYFILYQWFPQAAA